MHIRKAQQQRRQSVPPALRPSWNTISWKSLMESLVKFLVVMVIQMDRTTGVD